MTQHIREVVSLLFDRHAEALKNPDLTAEQQKQITVFYVHAIRHLAYPDRDTYPKTRRATKGAPIVRR